MAINLIHITEGKPVPGSIVEGTRGILERIQQAADLLMWEECLKYESMNLTRNLDELTGGLMTIINSVAENVRFYRTDFIHDLLCMNRIISSLEAVSLLHELPFYIIGMRDYGVDHWAYMESRLKEPKGYDVYSDVYLLTIVDGFENTCIKTYRAKGRR